MNDTPKDVQVLYRTLLMQRSGAERLAMGCTMFDTSRALAKASLQAQGHNATALRVGFFERTYQNDFDAETRRHIVAWLSRQEEKSARP